jgi:anti-sigma regulatory factor (Ser/Thr protein kinase)
MRLADRISLVPTPADVSRFNAWFDEKCSRAGIAKMLAADLKLCVNEVLANAISYGFRGIAKPWITVRIQLDKSRASATIIDNGTYFDLRGWRVQQDRDLMTGEPGGFGIALIKERAKHIDYSRFCGRNHLRITCELAAPCTAGPHT